MRLKDWPSRLEAAMLAARRRPFEWGSHDCCLFAAAIVEACTGDDFAAAYRGTYTDAAGAVALLDSLGGVHVLAALAGPEIEPTLATAGDVGLAEIEGRQSLVVHGGQVWMGAGADGLLICPADAVTKAWQTGGGNG